jgi:hypothetical protein
MTAPGVQSYFLHKPRRGFHIVENASRISNFDILVCPERLQEIRRVLQTMRKIGFSLENTIHIRYRKGLWGCISDAPSLLPVMGLCSPIREISHGR